MKLFTNRDYDAIMAIARFLKSDHLGVIICILGTILQSVHTFQIIYDSSAIANPTIRLVQAVGVALFFSFSLVIYTFRAGSISLYAIPDQLTPQKKYAINKRNEENKSKARIYKKYARGLAVFEFIINLHYWTKDKIIRQYSEGIEFVDIAFIDWYEWGITVVYSFALPYMIASFAGHVKIKENLLKTNLSNLRP